MQAIDYQRVNVGVNRFTLIGKNLYLVTNSQLNLLKAA